MANAIYLASPPKPLFVILSDAQDLAFLRFFGRSTPSE